MIKKDLITYLERWHVICDECNTQHLAFPMELNVDKEVRSCGWEVESGKHICIECQKNNQKREISMKTHRRSYNFPFPIIKCHLCECFSPFLALPGKSIFETAADNGWLIDNDNHYCPDCWYLDGDEPVIGRHEPRNMIAVRLNEGMVL